MYAIKARFDGQKITPEEPVPVNRPYEAIVTFTEPAKEPEKPDIMDFAGIFDQHDVDIIEEITREKRAPYERFANEIS